ncbi:MAG: homoserine dehydrogenase [Elusimicrobiota bacterium]
MKEVKIAIAGFGTVGVGTMQLLNDHKDDIEQRVGAPISVKWVCSRSRKRSPLIPKHIEQTNNWRDIVNDPEVDCVIELFGGIEPAKSLVVESLKNGKHVVTANKAILSKYWNEIFGLAREYRKLVYFEAAVGGGIPVVQALNEGLAANEVDKIIGILNGTTNFILTKMQELGLSFKKALVEAQKAGFAEADPSFDVEGIDAAQKISILGSLAAGDWIPPAKVHCEGITHLELIDIHLIQTRLNSTIKLLAIAENTPHGWVLRVHPTVVPKTHPFANVRNEYNAVALYGNAVGDVMLSGKGAGRFPTSSAVVSDIIFLCRQIVNGTAGWLPYVSQFKDYQVKLGQMNEIESKFYLRIMTADRPGVLAKITSILGKNEVSIASVYQDTNEGQNLKKPIPIVLLTHQSREKNVQEAVKAINDLNTTKSDTVILRTI